MFEQLQLDTELCRALAEMGFKRPTGIQQKVLPEALDAKDILASAPTGTGKTAAFLLPACQYLLDYPRKNPGHARVLVLTPTRELALQVHRQAEQICQFTSLTCGAITGGINYGTDHELLEDNLDILVATPGRLFEHIQQERFDCREIECLILDEADRMLDMGFADIVHQIAAEARWRKQTMLFSATLEGNGVQGFAEEILNEPAFIEAEATRKESPKIIQWLHYADNFDHKYALLRHILQDTPSCIVFVKTRERLNSLQGKLQSDNIPCTWLRGEMPQDKRNQALAAFKEQKTKVLLATDVAARGLDVQHVTHVVNFDMPRTADIYVHRIGRTGRAGKKGTAISLVEAHDMAVLGKIQRYTGEALRARVIEGLKPQHKIASVPKKKKKPKNSGKKTKKGKK